MCQIQSNPTANQNSMWVESPWGPPLANKPSPAVSIPLTPIHFGITLTANNFTLEVFKGILQDLALIFVLGENL